MILHFDKSLSATAKMLSAVIEDEGLKRKQKGQPNVQPHLNPEAFKREIEFEFEVRMTPEFNNINGGAYYQIFSQTGKTIARSPSLGKNNLEIFDTDSQTPKYRNCILPDNKKGRTIIYRFLPRADFDKGNKRQLPKDRVLTLTVARETTELYGYLWFLRWLLFSSSLVIIFISTGVAYLLTLTSLRPVNILAKKIESIREDNLGQHFPPAEFPAELHPICERMNNLLTRLKDSFERERRFNKDLAHELRTPLSGMLATIEVCLSRQRQPDEYHNSLGNCLHIVKTMNRMIDMLLSLSKIESGQISIQNDSINLKSMIDDYWRNIAETASAKELIFENSVQNNLTCKSDKDHLGMIITNLLDNAAEYTNQAGQVRVKAKQLEDFIILSISNTGCSLTQQQVEHIFEFFWRKDESRTDTGRHCGIGLAVVRKISDILGIEVKAELEDDGIFTIHLSLPSTFGHS
ncbi:MAG: ATP-binding protein [Planctomycetota bacterium]|jgi:signal transduction histidine kinase